MCKWHAWKEMCIITMFNYSFIYFVLTVCFRTVHVCSLRCAMQMNGKGKWLHLKPISFTLIKPKDKCEKNHPTEKQRLGRERKKRKWEVQQAPIKNFSVMGRHSPIGPTSFNLLAWQRTQSFWICLNAIFINFAMIY